MHRREFVTLLGAVSALPIAAHGQQSAVPVIGFMSGRSAQDSTYLVDAVREGLRDVGYLEGETVSIMYRWANGDYDR